MAKFGVVVPMKPTVALHVFGPAASEIISNAFLAISSVRSMRVPVAAFSRNWNWPVSTRGNISVPT